MDDFTIKALSQLLAIPVLGAVFVLLVMASWTGVIQWGPAVKSILSATQQIVEVLKETLTKCENQNKELLSMVKELTATLHNMAAAQEERNRIDRELMARRRN
jgi:signal transduction histidine kinase